MIYTDYSKCDEVRALGSHHTYKIHEELVNKSTVKRERNCFTAVSFRIVLGKDPDIFVGDKTSHFSYILHSVQFSSVAQLCPSLYQPMDCRMPGFPVHHQLLELTQTHIHGVGDAIQPSHPLSSPSPHTCNLPQHQGLFKWVSFSHQVANVLEFQLQNQSF